MGQGVDQILKEMAKSPKLSQSFVGNGEIAKTDTNLEAKL
jgi:hypothetical protein